jgi:hypothetical protein
MKRRKFDCKLNAQIVLEGLRGRSIAEICNEYELSSSQYYKLREQFLENASHAFDSEHQSKREARLQAENKKLKGVIGDLSVELKKSAL